jgi:hypothetical protein
VLQDAGKVTAESAKAHAESDFDRVIKQIESGRQPDIAEE